MINKKYIIILLSILSIFTSCNEDDPDNPTIGEITIDSISTNFIFQGNILTITGNNFINENHSTKVKIFDDYTGNVVLLDVTPISNTEIQININQEIDPGKKVLAVEISDVSSGQKHFFIMTKDWYNINESIGASPRKVFLHENSSMITILEYNGKITQVDEGNENGYTIENTVECGNRNDLKMFNDDNIVACGLNSYFTTDNFQSYNNIPNLYGEHDYIYYSYPDIDFTTDLIIKVDEDGYITTNGLGTYVRSNDNGVSFEILPTPFMNDLSARIFKIGQASNGKYYQFGLYVDYNSSPLSFTNLVMSSNNGFDDWVVVDNSIEYSHDIMNNITFYDEDLLFSINEDKELIKSTDLTQTWELVEADVDAFFMKSETNWYKVSNNKLYHTENSGENWELELELPNESANYFMDFKANRTIISGRYFIYIKHE